MILDDYQKRVDQLFEQIKTTQRENIITAGKMIAETIDAGGNIYLSGICHSIEMDLFNRGGGPAFYRFTIWLILFNVNYHYQSKEF